MGTLGYVPGSNSSPRGTSESLGFFPFIRAPRRSAGPPIAVKQGPTSGAEPQVNNKPTYISREGLEKLRRELDETVSIRRPEVAGRIHDAKEHGDLSENAEYEDAKNEQAFVEGRIQTLEALIKNATLIDEHHSKDVGPPHRRPHFQREPGRSSPPGSQEGREGYRSRPRGRYRVRGRQDRLGFKGRRRRPCRRGCGGGARAGAPEPPQGAAPRWSGRTSWPRGSPDRRSSTTRRPRPGRSTSGACAAR